VKHTGLLLFRDLYAAAAAIAPLRDAGAAALELMDAPRCARSKRSRDAAADPLAPGGSGRDPGGVPGCRSEERPALERKADAALAQVQCSSPRASRPIPRNSCCCGGSARAVPVGGGAPSARHDRDQRGPGLPVERLADASLDLTRLFSKHGYPTASCSATPRTETCTS
jgi:D-lactate dehydrogenase